MGDSRMPKAGQSRCVGVRKSECTSDVVISSCLSAPSRKGFPYAAHTHENRYAGALHIPLAEIKTWT